LPPLWFPHSTPLLGVPGLVAGQVAAPGGAGHRQKRRGRRCPLNRTRRGAVPPSSREREGALPPSQPSTGAQVGPWLSAAAGGAPAAPKTGVAPATPKRRGEGGLVGFW